MGGGDKIRLMIKFESQENSSYDSVNKHTIQGFIYSLLKEDTPFSNYHDFKGFKYFNFTNIFPVSDFNIGESKNLIISSPKQGFIRTLYKSLKNRDFFYFGENKMEIKDIKTFQPKLTRRFITSTPIVLFENNRENRYYSIKSNDFSFFMDRIKENALKKYNAYQNDNYSFEGNIFDRFEFDREVAVRVKKADKMFIIIGTLWKNLEKFNMDDKRFYRFIMETGLGEKNSLGFGMVNVMR